MDAAQDLYAPKSICFGCGPANGKGLRIKSRWEGDVFVCRFRPAPEHQAFPGVVNGGIIGTLFDCHENWCAATAMMRAQGLREAPPTVTAEFSVRFRKPTPMDVELELRARPMSTEGDRVTVEAELVAGGQVTATSRGLFVAVKEGHPAFHRWV